MGNLLTCLPVETKVVSWEQGRRLCRSKQTSRKELWLATLVLSSWKPVVARPTLLEMAKREWPWLWSRKERISTENLGLLLVWEVLSINKPSVWVQVSMSDWARLHSASWQWQVQCYGYGLWCWDCHSYCFLWRRGLSTHRWPLHLSTSYSAGSAVRAAVWQAHCRRSGVDRQGYGSAVPYTTEVQPFCTLSLVLGEVHSVHVGQKKIVWHPRLAGWKSSCLFLGKVLLDFASRARQMMS